ncbi:MAG: protein kinase [Myxococcales bacterium]|nr:protein kinase [Myxococcales bacterium]
MLESLNPQKPAPILGRYEVVGRLGEGGMAETWLCKISGYRGFSRHVVVKVLQAGHLDDPDYHDMFFDEARIGTLLKHPNIPRVEEFDVSGGVPFIVQEYVDGPSLLQLLKRRGDDAGLPARIAVRVLLDVASALDYAHRATDPQGAPLNLVHRDISAANILVASGGQAQLIDFGVARFEDRESTTQTDVIKGKFRYLAPEALTGSTPSPAMDIFSLGVVLFTALVGRFPWRADAMVSDRFRNLDVKGQLAPELDPAIDVIVRQCLHQRPEQRPTARGLRQALEQYLEGTGGPVTDEQVSDVVRQAFPEGRDGWLSSPLVHHSALATATPHPPRRSRTWIGISLVTLLVLQALVVLWVATRDTEPVPTDVEPSMGTEGLTLLLDEAESLIAAGQFRAAQDLLQRTAAVDVPDPDVLIRTSQLTSSAERGSLQQQALGAMNVGDRTLTRKKVEALLLAFPSDEVGLKLLQDLQPKRPPPAPDAGQGFLRLEVAGGILVAIDGDLVGLTPLDEIGLPPGPHEIVLRREGFADLSRTISIEKATTYALHVELEPVETPGEPVTPPSIDEEAEDVVADPPVEPPPSEEGAPDQPMAAIRFFPTEDLQLRRKVPLAFPGEARDVPESELACTARVFIDERGTPYDVVPDATCPGVLHQSTVVGLSKWRWYPPKMDGEKVKAQTRVRVRYKQ